MENSRQIAGLLGPSLSAVLISEFPLVQPHLYDAQIPPVVHLSGALFFVAGLAIVRAHKFGCAPGLFSSRQQAGSSWSWGSSGCSPLGSTVNPRPAWAQPPSWCSKASCWSLPWSSRTTAIVGSSNSIGDAHAAAARCANLYRASVFGPHR